MLNVSIAVDLPFIAKECELLPEVSEALTKLCEAVLRIG
jgi:hypothetical protein